MRLFGDTSYIVHYLRWLGLRPSRGAADRFELRRGGQARHPVPQLGRQRNDGRGRAVHHQRRLLQHVLPAVPGVDRGGQLPGEPDRLSRAGPGRATTACSRRRSWFPSTDTVRRRRGPAGLAQLRDPAVGQARQQLDVSSADELRRGLRAKNIHNTVTIALYAAGAVDPRLRRHRALPGRRRPLGLRGCARRSRWPPSAIFVVHRRLQRPGRPAGPAAQALRPQGCSIYDRAFWRHERFWKMAVGHAISSVFNGTPFKNVLWRLLGARIGRRVFDDGCRHARAERSSPSVTTARSTRAASSSATRRRTAGSSPTASRSVPAARSASAPGSTTA